MRGVGDTTTLVARVYDVAEPSALQRTGSSMNSASICVNRVTEYAYLLLRES